jgi:hypothetical protein
MQRLLPYPGMEMRGFPADIRAKAFRPYKLLIRMNY